MGGYCNLLGLQEVQNLAELNYPVPALRRGIARKQALS